MNSSPQVMLDPFEDGRKQDASAFLYNYNQLCDLWLWSPWERFTRFSLFLRAEAATWYHGSLRLLLLDRYPSYALFIRSQALCISSSSSNSVDYVKGGESWKSSCWSFVCRQFLKRFTPGEDKPPGQKSKESVVSYIDRFNSYRSNLLSLSDPSDSKKSLSERKFIAKFVQGLKRWYKDETTFKMRIKEMNYLEMLAYVQSLEDLGLDSGSEKEFDESGINGEGEEEEEEEEVGQHWRKPRNSSFYTPITTVTATTAAAAAAEEEEELWQFKRMINGLNKKSSRPLLPKVRMPKRSNRGSDTAASPSNASPTLSSCSNRGLSASAASFLALAKQLGKEKSPYLKDMRV